MPQSVADTPVKFTFFPGGAESPLATAVSWEGTWDDFLDGVFVQIGPKVSLTDKLDVPLIVPVTWKHGAAKKELKYVESVCLGSLDFDGGKEPGSKKSRGITQEQYDDILRRLEEEGLEALVYSTWGHGEVRPNYKIRVLVPLSRHVEPHEWKRVWSAFNGLMGSIADVSCKDPSRGYFWPSCPKNTHPRDRILLHIEGKRALDVDFLLSGSEEQSKGVEQEAIDELEGTKRVKVTRDKLKQFARRKSRSKVLTWADVGDRLLKVVDGESFADDGERDNTCFVLAKELAKEFPKADPKSLAEHFAASLSQMGDDAPSVEEVENKIRRAQVGVIAEQKALQRERDNRRKESPDQYTPEVLDEYCRQAGSTESHETFRKQLVLQSGTNFFVFMNGTYRKCSRSELPILCRDAFVPFEDIYGAKPYVLTNGGSEKPKAADQLVYEHGTVVDKHVMRLGEKYTHCYRHRDGEREQLTLVESVCPQRTDLVAERSLEVENWLEVMCSDENIYEVLQDWLAVFPDLTKPLAMLVLVGRTSMGKTEMASGLGRIWVRAKRNDADPIEKRTWTDMSEIFENFNGALLRCPLLVADEEMPRDTRGHVPTAKIRSMIGSNVKFINEKFKEQTGLEGYLRFLATANNMDRVSLGGSHNREDIEAINQRMRIIQVAPGTTKLFNFEKFVAGEELAKHVLWLHENRELPKTYQRFGVPLIDHTILNIYTDDATERLLEWSYQFLIRRVEEKNTELPAFVLGGRLFINPELIGEHLETVTGTQPPNRKKLRNAARNISAGTIRQTSKSGQRRRYHCIDTVRFMQYVQDIGADKLYAQWQLQADTLLVLESRARHALKPGAFSLAKQWRDIALRELALVKDGKACTVEVDAFAAGRPYQIELERDDD